jgi:hypothetical protein
MFARNGILPGGDVTTGIPGRDTECPAETGRRRNDCGNAGISGQSEPRGKMPGSRGLDGGGSSLAKPVCKPITGNFLKIAGQNRFSAD